MEENIKEEIIKKESGDNDQPVQVDGDGKRDKSVQKFNLKELNEKPLSVSIVLLTFVGGLLLSLFRFLSYIEEKQYFDCFNISSKFLPSSLSESTMISIVSLVMFVIIFPLVWCLIARKTEKASEKSDMYTAILILFLMLYYFSFFVFVILTIGSEFGKFSLKRVISDIFFIEALLLFSFPIFSWACIRYAFSKKKDRSRKKEKKNSCNATKKSKEKRQKDVEDDISETGDSISSVASFGMILLLLLIVIAAPHVFVEKAQFLYRLDHSVVTNNGVMYAIIYKTDDYVIGEVVEQKTNQDGETYYEIDTSKQQLFDSFDFEMKYLGKDVSFELKPFDTTQTNPTVPNTTSTSATASETTVPYTSTTNATSNNP